MADAFIHYPEDGYIGSYLGYNILHKQYTGTGTTSAWKKVTWDREPEAFMILSPDKKYGTVILKGHSGTMYTWTGSKFPLFPGQSGKYGSGTWSSDGFTFGSLSNNWHASGSGSGSADAAGDLNTSGTVYDVYLFY